MWQIRIWSQNQHTGKKKKKVVPGRPRCRGREELESPEGWRSPCSWGEPALGHDSAVCWAPSPRQHPALPHPPRLPAGAGLPLGPSSLLSSFPGMLALRSPLTGSSSKFVVVAVWLLSHVWLSCDPVDGSPPGSSVPEICQARVLEWVAISTFQFKHHLLRDTCPDRRVKWSHSHLLCHFLDCTCLITLWHLLVS